MADLWWGGEQDTALDCPDAATCMALFLARMVVDHVLPPPYLEQLLPSLTDGSLGVSVVHSAGAIFCSTLLIRTHAEQQADV